MGCARADVAWCCRGSAATSSWWNSRSALLVGRSHLAVSILPPRRATRSMEPDQAGDPGCIFLGFRCRRIAVGFSQHFAPEESLKPVPAEFCPAHAAQVSANGRRETFGFWLPTRRSAFNGVQAMANNLAKMALPAPVLEETTYPYLDQSLIEFFCPRLPNNGCARANGVLLCGVLLQASYRRKSSPEKQSSLPRALRRSCLISTGVRFRALTVPRSAHGWVMWMTSKLLKTVADIRAEKRVPLCAYSGRFAGIWLRDLAQRGLLDLRHSRSWLPLEGRCRCTPSPDPNDLPPVHSGRNISTKENHHDVQQTRSNDAR